MLNKEQTPDTRFNWLSDDEWLEVNHPQMVVANQNSRTLRGYYAEQVYKKQMPEGTLLRVPNLPYGDIDAIEPERGRIEIKFRNNVLKPWLAEKNEIKYYFKVFAFMNDVDYHYHIPFYEDIIDKNGNIQTLKRDFWFCDNLELAKQNLNIIFKYKESFYSPFKK